MKRFLVFILVIISNSVYAGNINYDYKVNGGSISSDTSVQKRKVNDVYARTKKDYEQTMKEENDYRPYPLNMFEFGSMPSSNSATGGVDYGNFMPRIQLPTGMGED